MLRTVTDPPIEHVLEIYAEAAPAKPRIRNFALRVALLQAARSETVGFYCDGHLIAAALLYPLDAEYPGEDLRELVFACRSTARLHLKGIVDAARLIAARLSDDPHLRIRATVASGHLPGQRLARLIGLRAAGSGGGLERWELSPGVQHSPEHQASVHRRREPGTEGRARAVGKAGR